MKNVLSRGFGSVMLCAMMVLGAFAMQGCTSPPGQAAVSFNTRVGQTISVVTDARKALTAAMSAGKITIVQDQKAQGALDLIRASLLAAMSLYATDPVQAEALAAKATKELASYQAPPIPPKPVSMLPAPWSMT